MKLDIDKILAMPVPERFKYLKANETELIKIKKSTPNNIELKNSIFNEITEKQLPRLNNADVLVFETNVKRSYNPQVYEMYKNWAINQHSIGLEYINISLAINDPEATDNYKFWNENIDKAINMDKAINAGFFFVVKEYKLIENSAVLWGANELTPTLSVEIVDNDTLKVKIVANTANWIDSQMDVLLPGAAKKSITERKKYIPHLHDHDWKTTSKVGDVLDIYETKINLTEIINSTSKKPEFIHIEKNEPKQSLDINYLISKL